MPRPRRVLAALAVLLLAACAGPITDAAPTPDDANPSADGQGTADDTTPERPLNVLFVLADDLGWADITPLNPDSFHPTPHLERLAASGMVLRQAYAASPVCSPTRYAILTGRQPARAAVTNWFSGRRTARFAGAAFDDAMPLEELTLAEAFGEAGYATFFAGKWHLGGEPSHWPEAQGFDVNRGGWSRGGPYGGGKYFSPYGNPRLEDGPDGEHLPDRLARETAAFIHEQATAERPFLAYLSFYSVHTPLMAPAERVAVHQARAAALDPQGRSGPVDEDFATEEQIWPTDAPRRVRVRQRHPTYAAMVEALDAAVGTVLDALDQAGVADSTLVVFFSDNGGLSTSEGHPTSNLPLRGGKGWLYEGGIREPLLVRWPGVTPPGSTSEVPVHACDLYPTLLEAAGLPARPDQHLDGDSLVDVLAGDDGPGERELVWHYPHYGNQGGFPGAALRLGDLKLLERFEDGRVQLYDLASDPGERHDLAAERPHDVARLRARLHAWYERLDARFLRALPDGPEPWRP